MNVPRKRAIQIVKKVDNQPRESVPLPASQSSIESAVAGWIGEHDVAQRNEKVFSNKNILKWRTVPEVGGEK